MTYFDYFRSNVLKENVDGFVKGTCDSMCPQEECFMREKEDLVHILEIKGSQKKLVKSFRRSAAASNIASPSLLRPFIVLRNVVEYLLLEVIKRSDVPPNVVYDFVTDRLKAVRQDAFVQEFPPEQCLVLLEPMIRFHIYYGYMLSNCPIEKYDPALNNKCTLECTKYYLNCCDLIDNRQYTDFELTTSNKFGINEEYNLTNDRILVESLYILCSLDSIHPLLRYHNLPYEKQRHPTLTLVYNIAIANMRGHYVRVHKLAEQLCPMTRLAFKTYLPTLQKRALKVMCHAYNSRQHTVPISAVKTWLGFQSKQHILTACCHYGIGVDEASNAVNFKKTSFKDDSTLLSPEIDDSVHDLPIEHLFTYKSSDYNESF